MRLALFATARSKVAATVLDALAESLPGTGSTADVAADAVLTSVPVASGATVPVSVMVTAPPAAPATPVPAANSVPASHVTVSPGPTGGSGAQVPRVLAMDVTVTPAGTASVTRTVPASDGP